MRILGILSAIFVGMYFLSTTVFAESVQAKFKEKASELPVFTEDKQTIVVSGNAQFVVKLKSNPTTGYSWFLREYNAGLIEPVKHEVRAAADKRLAGAPGYELWTFRVRPAGSVVPQQTMLRFVYIRPWEAAESSAQLVFKVVTRPK